ncbi:hypothetical protein TUN199_06131 [Pyrenophora tritici-repentis]|uniref:F-box domain-containing protein n=1 Tax=Pyrenophora tritici-repentis TaxID=45151 RepID=A0A5M9LJ07_9PLEO|nr:hypothetical protein PtrV1_04790 [Pyrenophora tritici-repentis]KAF7574382.1 hypothetical protein PtrM4_060050 [Pyrenophora tritici-repentis]KAI0570297.1 hypothetical protein Alg215_11139 [Pyrenophora tritici-repentis]KAI0582987.1 hypothetical protein Alg130_05910 [Pyrenophora tritici-repentis]KAI0609872.1 hypothetical protein TUN205_05897 [Pyrenophora tritici-repentis]
MVTISLPDLPPELLAEVKTNLSYGSCVALRLTCRELYHKIDDPNQHTRGTHSDALTRASSITRNYDMKDLLEIELWPEYNSAYYRPTELKQPIRGLDFFACHICRKIRCTSKFSNAMMKSKRGKLGNGTVAEKAGRFCIPCGIRVGIYKRGDWLQYGGATGSYGFICHRCGTFQESGFEYLAANARFCANCRAQ